MFSIADICLVLFDHLGKTIAPFYYTNGWQEEEEEGDNKSHRDGKPGFVCLLVLGFQRALTNIFTQERNHDSHLLEMAMTTVHFEIILIFKN